MRLSKEERKRERNGKTTGLFMIFAGQAASLLCASTRPTGSA